MIRRTFQYFRAPLAVLIGGFLMLALSVPSTALEQVIIQKSASNAQVRAANNYIDSANTTANHPNALQVQSSLLGGNQRALLLFDLSLLPNVGIKSASMILTVQTAPLVDDTYGAYPLASFFTQSAVTWSTRVADLTWGAAGGDIPSTATATVTPTGRPTQLAWNVTPDMQSWYAGNSSGVPVPNFGELIKDQTENDAVPDQIVFYSNTGASPPELAIQFVQNVTNLTATAGSSQVRLNWGYPTAIGTVMDPTKGVLVVRSAGIPVNKNTVPTDGTPYTPCTVLNGGGGNGTVVFNSTTMATTFTDNSSDTCGAPANGTVYYYKVFAQDSALNYSASGSSAQGGSVSVPEISAMPSASSPFSSNWILATYSTTLAPPSLFPGLVTMLGTQTDFIYSVNPNTGLRPYPRISLNAAISGRSPIISAAESSLGQDMIYAADQKGLAYGIAADTGQIVWVVDPLSSRGTPFFAAGALLVKNFATSSYTLSHDLLVLGTRNSTTTTGNAIVAVDGNTGATVWSKVGGSGGVPSMDIINNTPVVSYTKNVIWVTSRSAGGTSQPSVWELNANTGAVIHTLALGDIDSSPVLTPDESILFVGNNAGTLYAINTSTATVITSIAGGDGPIIDYPTVVGFSSPYSVYFSGTADVHGLTYNTTTSAFTANWSTPVSTPSAPIAVFGLGDVYVGSADRTIHELNATTGANIRNLAVDLGQTAVVGDPSLDTSLMHIYVSVSDQRVYSFPFPF